jgi:Yip1 domain
MASPQLAIEKPLSEFSRIMNVFVDPKRAFADIVARPRWYIPIIIMSVLLLVLMYCYGQHVGWERIVRQQMEQSSRVQQLSPEQREQSIAMGVKFGSVMAYVQAIIGPILGAVIVGGILMFVANFMLGAQLRFPQMLGITSYSFLTGLVSIPLTLIVMYTKSPEDFDIRNPLAFNPGAFLPESTPKWLVSLASSFDLFSFWTIALLAIGISVAGRRLSFGKALGAVLIPWLVWVCGKTAWTAIFS